jgi:hypothetical protein
MISVVGLMSSSISTIGSSPDEARCLLLELDGADMLVFLEV